MKPRDATDLAEAVRAATSPFSVIGLGTKLNLGRPVSAPPLDLSNFKGIVAYEPEELILECGAATKLSDVEKLLAAQNQMLAFEPPNYAGILSTKHSGSIGGTLACNLAGPRRLKAGAARDHILGFTGVNGQGEIIRAGARVVKNVTGYDLPRLMAGSYGTLMTFTSVIFKVLPKPETEQTCVLADHGVSLAVAQMAQVLATGAEVSSAAYVPKHGVYLRIEGIKASVKARIDMLHAGMKLHEVLPAAKSRKLWQELRDVQPLADQNEQEIWRIVMPPSETSEFLAALPFAHDYYLDWAGALTWLAAKPGADVRRYMNSGVATLFRADEAARAETDVFHPQAPELAALSVRIKNAFDPRRLFNPHKMYREF